MSKQFNMVLPYIKLDVKTNFYLSLECVYVTGGHIFCHPSKKEEAEEFVRVHNALLDSPLIKALS